MDPSPSEVMTLIFPQALSKQQTMRSSPDLAVPFQHTLANLAGQLAPRSRRIYQTDVAAFLWWLAEHQAGETPGRYQARKLEVAPLAQQDAALLLSGLTREAVIAYRAYLEATYPKTTASRRLTVLRRLCAEAKEKGLLAVDPTERVRGFSQAAPQETPHTALELDPLREFLASLGTRTLKDLRDKALLMVLARLGLRREEASQLDWNDLQPRQGHTVLVIRHGKGDQRRVAKVPIDVLRLLEQYRAALGEETQPMFVVLRKGSHLRRDEAGRVIRLDGKGIERMVVARSRQAKLNLARPLTPHDLRSTFITLALEGKAPLHLVQYAAGHKDPRTTEHYQRRKVNLDDNAVDYIHY
jgi:integrase